MHHKSRPDAYLRPWGGQPAQRRDPAAPISCLNRAVPVSPGDLEFGCGGDTDGTSGSPLVASLNPVTGLGTVIGVIGGYQQGGITASVSYADQLGAGVASLYEEATARS